MSKNVIIGQSGGPTAVINSSLAGVYKAACSLGADKVYGMKYGIEGLLKEEMLELNVLLDDRMSIELLKRTPSSFLGSCRYKLPDWHDDETVYKKLFAILEKLNIGYFFYIGGNDSMDTCNKINQYMQSVGYDCRVMGVPKTIDNDLFGNLVPAGAQSRGGGVLQQPQLLRVLLPHVKQPVGQHALDAVLRAQHLGDGAGLQRRVDDAVGAGIDDRRGTAGLADDTRAAQFFHRSIPPKHRLRFDDAPAHACDAPPVCLQIGILPWKFGNVNAFALANMKKYDTIGM